VCLTEKCLFCVLIRFLLIFDTSFTSDSSHPPYQMGLKRKKSHNFTMDAYGVGHRHNFHPHSLHQQHVHHQNNHQNHHQYVASIPINDYPAHIRPKETSASSFPTKLNDSKASTLSSSSSKTKVPTSFRVLKYFVFIYLLVILAAEISWAVYSCQSLKRDLQAEVDAGQLDQTYMREFYKSTKNFFMFILILIFLAICIGCAAVGSENKALVVVFMIILAIEWIFEIMGIYNSGDRNVVIYRMIPALLRPGLVVSIVFFYRVMSKAEHLQTKDSLEEGGLETPSTHVVSASAAAVLPSNGSLLGKANS